MRPLGDMMGFSQIDITDGGPLATPVTNELTNFGWEFVWHCHILSHEENDMMRSTIFKVKDHIGVLSNGQWYLDGSGNGAWEGAPVDRQIAGFAPPVVGGIPVSGDWNADGTAKIGLFKDGAWYVDLDGNGIWDGAPTDGLFSFGGGVPGAIPVTGDWTGTGTTKIGIFVNGTWYLDLNGNGAWDGTPIDGLFNFGVGVAGAIPLTGDWTGTGTAKIGIFADATWYIDLNGNGAWDGTPSDGLFNFGGGVAGAVPATGDWTGNGTAKIGIFADGVWYLDMNGNNVWDGTPTDSLYSFGLGLPGAAPVIGKW
jgi:hypothetical protein